MNRSLVSSLLACALLAPAAFIRAQDTGAPAGAPPPPPPAKHHEKTTELGKRMERIGKAMKALHKQIDDPASNASSLEWVAKIQAAAQEALTFKPEKEADLPEDQQASFQDNYEKAMKQFIASVNDLADALKANDNAKAEDIFKSLGQIERKDHKQFRKPHPKD